MTIKQRAQAFHLGLVYGTAVAQRFGKTEQLSTARTGLTPPSSLAGTKLALHWIDGTKLAARVLCGLV